MVHKKCSLAEIGGLRIQTVCGHDPRHYCLGVDVSISFSSFFVIRSAFDRSRFDLDQGIRS